MTSVDPKAGPGQGDVRQDRETETYSPRQVEALLAVPASTLRVYATRFADLLSTSASGGRRQAGRGFGHRRYTAGDIAKLEQIKMLLDSGLSYALVRAQLTDGVPPRPPLRRRQTAQFDSKRRRAARRVEIADAVNPSSSASEAQSSLAPVPRIDEGQLARAIVDLLPPSREPDVLARLHLLESISVEQSRQVRDLSHGVIALEAKIDSLHEKLDRALAMIAEIQEEARRRSRLNWLRRLFRTG
ncbi:MAG TPA: MerR family transcriptional regulator [Chloroflexota bacterium]|nr:MerR family transcriptional regulator [Chloroflexota bacterium]